MAIVIAGYIKVDPEKRKGLLTDGRQYIEASRAEPGCERYDWSADLVEAGIIYVFERWTDEASLAAHFGASPYKNTLAMFDEAGVLDLDMNKHRVDIIEPVYDETQTPRADFFTATE